jgi:hypothetical protein
MIMRRFFMTRMQVVVLTMSTVMFMAVITYLSVVRMPVFVLVLMLVAVLVQVRMAMRLTVVFMGMLMLMSM